MPTCRIIIDDAVEKFHFVDNVSGEILVYEKILVKGTDVVETYCMVEESKNPVTGKMDSYKCAVFAFTTDKATINGKTMPRSCSYYTEHAKNIDYSLKNGVLDIQ